MRLRAMTLLALLSVSNAALAGGVAFRFGEDSFGASLATEMNAQSSAQLDWMHHEDGADMVAAGVFANGNRGTLTGRVGVKAIGLEGDDENFDGGAMAFGGDLALPLNDVVRLRGGLYYAPEATAFSDVEGYREWSVSAEFALFQNSALQVGYAEYEFEAEQGSDFEFEDGVFVRLMLRL